MNSRLVVGAVAALSLAFVACGGKSGEEITPTCTITLSGAVTASFDCAEPATLSWVSETGVLVFGVGTADADRTGVLVTNVMFHLPAPPELKTYQATDTGAGANLIVATDLEHYWQAALGFIGSTGGPASVTLTSIGEEIGDPASGTHLVHGTLHATLIHAEGSSSTGEVVLDATF